jgi:DNA polymerase-3 subunit gamma/tau
MLIYNAVADHAALKEAGDAWGIETLLAAIQVLDQAVLRMRSSAQVRTLIEIALVRICKLEDLDAIPASVARLQAAAPGSPSPASSAAPRRSAPQPGGPRAGTAAQKKKELTGASAAPAPQARSAEKSQRQASHTPPSSENQRELSASTAEQKWREALDEIGGLTAECAGNFDSLAISAPNLLVVHLKTAYNKEWCERADVKRRLEQVMSRVSGQAIRIDFAAPAKPKAVRRAPRPTTQSRLQSIREAEQNPLVQEAISLFDAEIVRVDPRRPG